MGSTNFCCSCRLLPHSCLLLFKREGRVVMPYSLLPTSEEYYSLSPFQGQLPKGPSQRFWSLPSCNVETCLDCVHCWLLLFLFKYIKILQHNFFFILEVWVSFVCHFTLPFTQKIFMKACLNHLMISNWTPASPLVPSDATSLVLCLAHAI